MLLLPDWLMRATQVSSGTVVPDKVLSQRTAAFVLFSTAIDLSSHFYMYDDKTVYACFCFFFPFH